MNISFQDLREETQLEIWEEVRSYLLWSESIEPRSQEESADAFERRVHEAVDDHINTHNHCITFDICQMTN